jgi:hypothetical protein
VVSRRLYSEATRGTQGDIKKCLCLHLAIVRVTLVFVTKRLSTLRATQ